MAFLVNYPCISCHFFGWTKLRGWRSPQCSCMQGGGASQMVGCIGIRQGIDQDLSAEKDRRNHSKICCLPWLLRRYPTWWRCATESVLPCAAGDSKIFCVKFGVHSPIKCTKTTALSLDFWSIKSRNSGGCRNWCPAYCNSWGAPPSLRAPWHQQHCCREPMSSSTGIAFWGLRLAPFFAKCKTN